MQAVKKGLRSDIDMTEGGIAGKIIRFSIPLLIGNLFQQLYNMVDTWVIGQTGAAGEYAAVGSIGPVINILIGFFLGFSSGAGVIISQYYGARNEEGVRRTVHTAITVTVLLSVVFTVAGILLAPYILKIMLDETQETYGYAVTYLRIYFAGVTGLLFYNMGAAILRAVGDSRHPFYFLIVSAVTNTVLDLVFVYTFEMGVAGVALATVIAQCLSAVLVVLTLVRSRLSIRLEWRSLGVSKDILKKISLLGLPAGVQMALTSFSNVFVQSYVGGTTVGEEVALGAWTTYTKVDQFIFLPVQSIGLAVTTFVGQNLGKGNARRARRGTLLAYAMATATTVTIVGIVEIFAPYLATLFNPDAAIVENATVLLRYLSPFYLLPCINQIFSASLRGAGNTRAPMITMLVSFVGFRQLYLFIVTHFISNDLLPVAFSYPVGWFLCAVITLLVYALSRYEKCALIEKAAT